MKFLKILIRAANRAWDSRSYTWWQLPLKSFALLGIVAGKALLGTLALAAAQLIEHWLPAVFGCVALVFELLITFIPTAILFYGFSIALLEMLFRDQELRLADAKHGENLPSKVQHRFPLLLKKSSCETQ